MTAIWILNRENCVLKIFLPQEMRKSVVDDLDAMISEVRQLRNSASEMQNGAGLNGTADKRCIYTIIYYICTLSLYTDILWFFFYPDMEFVHSDSLRLCVWCQWCEKFNKYNMYIIFNRTTRRNGKLQDKVFVARNSYLTDLFEISHFRTIYNIFIVMLMILFLNTAVHDFIETGTWVLLHIIVYALVNVLINYEHECSTWTKRIVYWRQAKVSLTLSWQVNKLFGISSYFADE